MCGVLTSFFAYNALGLLRFLLFHLHDHGLVMTNVVVRGGHFKHLSRCGCLIADVSLAGRIFAQHSDPSHECGSFEAVQWHIPYDRV